jgi:cytochrome c-type biogenesis protein CcmE
MAKRRRPRWGQIVTWMVKLLVAIASVIAAVNQSGPSR